MQVVEMKTTLKVDDILNGISKLETKEIESFLKEVSIILANKKAPSLPSEEVILLKKINESLSTTTRLRYRKLREKQQGKTLSSEERNELLQLVEVVENADVERLKAMIDLSKSRKITLDEVMNDIEFNKLIIDIITPI